MAQPCDGDAAWVRRYRRWETDRKADEARQDAGTFVVDRHRPHQGETKLSENRWAAHVAGAAASRGKVNVVADATLSPPAARAYASSILAAADDAERQSSGAAAASAA
jgi:hypothetical protein